MNGGIACAAAFGGEEHDGVADFQVGEESFGFDELKADFFCGLAGEGFGDVSFDGAIGFGEGGDLGEEDGAGGGVHLGDGELELDDGGGGVGRYQEKKNNE